MALQKMGRGERFGECTPFISPRYQAEDLGAEADNMRTNKGSGLVELSRVRSVYLFPAYSSKGEFRLYII